MSSSNCCFFTHTQISQEAGQVVWYSHLFKNFPQLVVVHTVKDFAIVNEEEVGIFLELSCFFDDLTEVVNLVSGSSAFSKSSLSILLKILQVRFQEYMNWEIPDVQTEFRKGRGTRDYIVNILCIIEKAREFQKSTYFCFINYV